jgi:hypothetical protein
LFAVIEQLAGIGRHQFFGGASAVWAGDNRDQSHGSRYPDNKFNAALRVIGKHGGGKRRSGIGAKVMRPPTEAAYPSSPTIFWATHWTALQTLHWKML